jgi:polysaccharide deacetylase 2 family uncharacterized protein YibQ
MESRTGKHYKQILKSTLFLLLACCTTQANSTKLASIIIDDLGNNYEHGRALVDFPAPLTLAFLPRTDFARELAIQAHRNQKEVMLHLPLQSVEHHKHSPGTLDLHMSQREFVHQLKANIISVPHVRGINNHMGSLLTRHPGHMNWLMEELAKLDDLYFIDSLTSNKSVASHFATEHRVPNMIRDIFLDPDDRPETLQKQFSRFINIANSRGYAIAIAHPYPETIAFIKSNLQELNKHNIKLVPVSQLINLHGSKTNVTCTGTTCSGM